MKKIVILVIASRNSSVIRHYDQKNTKDPKLIYDKMILNYWKYLIEYCNIYHKNIKIYLVFGNTKTDDLNLDNNILKFKIKESFINILNKTIKAIEYINENVEYDFIFRTNLSSFIIIDNLLKIIDKCETYSGYIHYDNKSKKSYLSGICMIYNKEGVNYILNNVCLLNKTCYSDDNHLQNIYGYEKKIDLIKYIKFIEFKSKKKTDKETLIKNIIKNNKFLIRIKNRDRNIDIDYLTFFTNFLYR